MYTWHLHLLVTSQSVEYYHEGIIATGDREIETGASLIDDT